MCDQVWVMEYAANAGVNPLVIEGMTVEMEVQSRCRGTPLPQEGCPDSIQQPEMEAALGCDPHRGRVEPGDGVVLKVARKARCRVLEHPTRLGLR